MTSTIDPTLPTGAKANSADLRANLAAAKAEIEQLQTDVAALQPSGPPLGVTDGSEATAGEIGEYHAASLAAPGINLVSGVNRDLVSLSLTAGDWDVEGAAYFDCPSGQSSMIRSWVNTLSATEPPGTDGGLMFDQNTANGQNTAMSIAQLRVLTASPVTVYLSVNATFNAAMQGAGFVRARRMR